MIGIFINLPDDLIKHIKQYIAPTPTAEIMKVHITRWTKKNYFHLWFKDCNRKVVNVLRLRACKRTRFIKERQDDIVKLFKKRGENMTVEKLIRINHELNKSLYESNKKYWLYVD